MKKILPDLEIPEDLLSRVIEHARREYPLEGCGLLAGKNAKITKAHVLDANGMPGEEVPLATSAGRKTLKFPADALYVVLE